MTSEPEPDPSIVPMAIAVEAGIGVVAVALGWALGYPPGPMIGWTLEGLVWGTLATLPLLAMLALCLFIPWRPMRELLRVVDELIVPLFRQTSLPVLAIIAALAGFGEEMLFRGVLQTGLADWIGGSAGVWVSLAVISLLFGLVHSITTTYALLAALIGLYLGWLWIATGNLLVPILAHGLYDFVALVYLTKVHHRAAASEQ